MHSPVRLRVYDRRIGDQVEFTEIRRQFHRGFAADQPFALPAIFDEVLDRTHLQMMLIAKNAKVGQTSHVAVGLDDFTNDCGFLEARQPGQIDAALGMAGPNQDAALAGAQKLGTWPLPRIRSAAWYVRRWPPARYGRGRTPRCRW